MSAAQLLQSVAHYELTRDIGQAYEYSNAGYQILGLAEASAGRADYGTLLKSRVLGPLHLNSTRVTPPEPKEGQAEEGLVAVEYDEHLNPLPHAPEPQLPGAAGMRSSANDLLDFLAANIGLTRTPAALAAAMADMVKVRRPTQYLERKAALGWHIATLHGIDIVWQNGGSAGHRAFVGFSPQLRAGVVVLSNSANTIDDIGVHLLDRQAPLRKLYRESPVSPGLYDNYIGRYQVSDTFGLSVTRDGNRLYIQATGQPRAELFAEGDDRFFLRVVNGEVLFQTDASGRARALSLAQGGKTATALRVR
jgi:CubicO group peptidase (beta-lactamase class C family)